MDLHNILIAATEAVQEVAKEENQDLLGTFGINWKLFLGQLVNFAIVLFVFWKWVVKPLGSTLTARQEKIESGLKNATYMEEEKQKFDQWKTDEMQIVRNEAEKVIKSANDTADKLRHESTLNAQEQADKIIQQAKSAIETEKNAMLKEVKASVAELIVMASEKIIHTKLDTAKDKELVSDAVKELS